MILFLKNFIHRLRWKIIALSAGFLILLVLLLPSPALAQWQWLVNTMLLVPKLTIGFMLVVCILLTQGIAYLMGALLDWVISPGFISFSYTNPISNPIIGMGLNITQPFVNMILVIMLVYIALSIALRIGEHNAKQIFAKLIVIALLVNFAPVICGLIVDAANITMNYFLEPIRGGISGIGTQFSPFVDSATHTILDLGGDITDSVGVLALGAAMIFLNLSLALAFLLFAGLFIFRYIAIWVLVILSPLAFAFWILPATKKLWDMWWNNFIQWSIIGIPIAFFLYLGMGSFSAISTAFNANLTLPQVESVSVGIFNQIFPFFVVAVFLMLGFVVGLATSAMGAESIIKGGKAAGAVAGKRGWSGTKRGAGATAGAVTGAYKNIGRTYKAGRSLGLSPQRAAGEAVKRHWQRRTLPAIEKGRQAIVRTVTTKAGAKRAGVGIWKGLGAARRGILSTVRDMAVVGGATALGVKVPKTGFRKCPTCGEPKVARSATACPKCGHVF